MKSTLNYFLVTASALILFSCQNELAEIDTESKKLFVKLELSSDVELQDVLIRFQEHNPSGRVSSFLDSVDFSHANKRVDEVTNITYYDFDVYNVKNLVYSKFVLREREDGEFYGTLIENEFDREWVSQYDSFPGWDFFTGYFRMYNIYGGLISENRMENGHSVDYSSSDGKLDAYTCVTSTVDWYTCHNGCDYNYTEVTTTCGWESYEEYYCDDMGCTDNQTGGTESLNFGDYTPPNTFQCSINTVEDLNGNCVEKPCSGNPLLDMEISQWNADKNSNRQGCARFKVNSVCDGNSDRRRHWGIDLKAPMLTNIYSVTGGLVYSTGTSTTLGNHIIIKNGNDYHLYAHLNELPNITGLVETGAVIGRSGDSGNAKDEPHLHYEVKHRSGTEPYNSMSFKDPEEFLTAKYDLNGNLISICN